MLSDGKKILFKQSNGLISVIQTLLCRKQQLRGAMLTLNMFVQTQMMLNTQVAQSQQLFWKTPKNSTNLFWPIINWSCVKLKISEGSVFTILHKHLAMRKLCSKWMLCLLTVNQKQHVDNSEWCLQLFQRYKKEFLHKYVLTDKT